MADNEVVKTVENVDTLFAQIEVNGQTYTSDRYTPPATPVVQNTTPSQSQQSSESEQTVNDTPVQGQDVYGVNLNNVLHDFKDPEVIQNLADEIEARDNADTALQNEVDTINSKIPAQATPSNQLADKSYVNNSISTNTANFLGTYETLEEIEAIPDPTNNDYAFLETATASQLQYDRYKYNSEEDEWLFEYSLIFPIGSGGGLAFSGTRAQYEVAKLIPEGEEGFIPEGAFVDITDENDYVKAEEHTNE